VLRQPPGMKRRDFIGTNPSDCIVLLTRRAERVNDFETAQCLF
jgi:hypothetical protein